MQKEIWFDPWFLISQTKKITSAGEQRSELRVEGRKERVLCICCWVYREYKSAKDREEETVSRVLNDDRPTMKYVAINGHNHYRFNRIVWLAWSDPLYVLYLLVKKLAYYLSGSCLRFSGSRAPFLPSRFLFLKTLPIDIITIIKAGINPGMIKTLITSTALHKHLAVHKDQIN